MLPMFKSMHPYRWATHGKFFLSHGQFGTLTPSLSPLISYHACQGETMHLRKTNEVISISKMHYQALWSLDLFGDEKIYLPFSH